MDDALEVPRPQLPTADVQEEDQSSGDEDGGLDWTKLPKLGTAARPVIPKRGEKDFEPAAGGGSGLQLHVLDRSREAMLEALRAGRSISSKSISYGLWYPAIDRVHVITARGIHFSTMGHSATRAPPSEGMGGEAVDAQSNSIPGSKLPKRLELLPEEALYLVERGALFCYKFLSNGLPLVDSPNFEMTSPGAPMSVQQAFAEMTGRDGMTLERYQVYAYLKRLGFILMRAEPPTAEYPVAALTPLLSNRPLTQPQTFRGKLTTLFSRFASNVLSVFRLSRRSDWWKHLQLSRYRTSADIFQSLRFIPCTYSVPLPLPSVSEGKQASSSKALPFALSASPYKVFFHVYKPSTPFRKTAPPAPDFYVVVVNARTTPMPSIQELTALFDILPVMPLPPPRKRGVQPAVKNPPNSPPTDDPATKAPPGISRPSSTPGWPLSALTFLRRLLFFLPFFCPTPPAQADKLASKPTRPPNPFLALKTGKKTIVIAAVDSGSISFFRFGQGVFEEWPMA
ncbi:hypothetical protein PAXRUDRAFT_829972 [Paxillus rubicundulus Ve08.2h10]|uniref:tRNA-splicing endonuclease subunit Sen54 N-terminal domain-containing protein n=1 Tax=Paxillus rubicundulus Ve08.2h10 TaxID=930991 RepID=A0A0D0DLX4_9AGAM|nr:hypothetical protein PAXRUDRAFT_829972 [Paxillus rubicundulus Ve08.2h10]